MIDQVINDEGIFMRGREEEEMSSISCFTQKLNKQVTSNVELFGAGLFDKDL